MGAGGKCQVVKPYHDDLSLQFRPFNPFMLRDHPVPPLRACGGEKYSFV